MSDDTDPEYVDQIGFLPIAERCRFDMAGNSRRIGTDTDVDDFERLFEEWPPALLSLLIKEAAGFPFLIQSAGDRRQCLVTAASLARKAGGKLPADQVEAILGVRPSIREIDQRKYQGKGLSPSMKSACAWVLWHIADILALEGIFPEPHISEHQKEGELENQTLVAFSYSPSLACMSVASAYKIGRLLEWFRWRTEGADSAAIRGQDTAGAASRGGCVRQAQMRPDIERTINLMRPLVEGGMGVEAASRKAAKELGGKAPSHKQRWVRWERKQNSA